MTQTRVGIVEFDTVGWLPWVLCMHVFFLVVSDVLKQKLPVLVYVSPSGKLL